MTAALKTMKMTTTSVTTTMTETVTTTMTHGDDDVGSDGRCDDNLYHLSVIILLT